MIRSPPRTPSSIARRVEVGRQSIVRRRSSTSRELWWRRLGIGCGPWPAPAEARPDARSSVWSTSIRGNDSLLLKGNLHMKLGIFLGYWGLGLSSQEQLGIVQEAERLGYDSAWAAEAYGSDAATVLGWLAGQTTRIRLGSGIFQMPARSPAMTAMTAATIDQLSGGRMILGIGSSGPQVAEGWHGQQIGRASC